MFQSELTSNSSMDGLTGMSTGVYSLNGVKGTDSPISLTVTHEMYLFIMFITLGIICQAIVVFGVITNVLNIIVFIREGFSEAVNISLLALTLSDLCSLICAIWSNLCYTTYFRENVPLLHTEDITLITGGWLHVVFTRITGWITAFITFERCVCVSRPLIVKAIFTTRTHIITMVAIFVVSLGCGSLAYVMMGLGWKFYPERNQTLIGLVHRLTIEEEVRTNTVAYAINGVFMPVSSFTIIVICTAVLVFKLNQNLAWRRSNESHYQMSVKKPCTQSKNQRVAKMVVFLSIMFICSFVPAVFIFIAASIEPELTYFGYFKHIFMITLSISFTAEIINSSSNIFVYYAMSSKYRKNIHGLVSLIF